MYMFFLPFNVIYIMKWIYNVVDIVQKLLGMCVHVRDRWKRGASALIASDLDLMETSYTKYHTYIALALHNAVQHKDADYCKYNFPPTILNKLFPSNLPLCKYT